MNFRFVDFNENINTIVSRENYSGKNLFICPNHRSLGALQAEFQSFITFDKIGFLTMDQFKERFLSYKMPPLKEEKRTLAFYASLCVEHKEHFHINDYFQSISLANQFFPFFEELNEENVSFTTLREQIVKKISEDQWQNQTFDILLQIRKNYYHYLNEHGFSDLIFAEIEDNSQFLSGYERVVVVNQFYLTKREKHLLPQNSTIYIQLPEQLYDKKELRCSNDLTAEYLKNIRTESVELHIFSNDFSLKHHLFSYEFDLKNDLLVDTGILRDHLDHYTPMVKRSIPFTSSSIYRFFDNIHHLLSGIIIQDNILLIEINSLVKVVNDKMFLKYFTPDECNEKDVGILSEILFNWLYSLIDNDYKYVDLSLQNSVSSPPQKIRTALENMFTCLLSYRSLTQFCDFCKLLNEYKLSKIISHDECCCSDLPDIYYQMLYDFSAIAQIKIIEDWKLVFPQNNSEFATGFSLLKLFLNYSKNKVFRFLRDEYDLDIPEITSINNTRNLTCEHIIIIDAVEGNLPPARKTPFFLTEAQRAMLQLKTYSDIVLREKYYFLRLVAQSRRVSILSRVEEKTTTELSSFVEELKLFQPQLFSNSASAFSTCMEDHIKKWLAPATSDLIIPKIPEDRKSVV